MSYAKTTCITNFGTFNAGDVIRPNGAHSAFADCLILGFSNKDKHGDVYVKLARPYAYASSVGTVGPTVLQGVEVFEITVTKLRGDHVIPGSNFCITAVEPHPDNIVDVR